MAKKIFLLLLFLTVSCGGVKEKKKPQSDLFTELRKGKNWEEIINFDINDVPSFLTFSYSKHCNSIFAHPVDMSDVSNFFLKIPLIQQKEKMEFQLLGDPGQCPTCLVPKTIESVTVCDSMVGVGMSYKGYNFYDCDGNFLFQFIANGCSGGPCFFYEDKLISFPFDSGFLDYAVYVFDLQTRKLVAKHIKKGELLKIISFSGKKEFSTKNGKVSGVGERLLMFDYVQIGPQIIMLPQANSLGTKDFLVVSLDNFAIKTISLDKYRKYLNKNFPEKHVEVFSTITRKKENLIMVRNLLIFERGEIGNLKKKYGYFLLLELDLEGNLKGMYAPPKGIFGENVIGVAPVDIEYIGNDEYLLNEFQFLKTLNKKHRHEAISHLIKFKAKKLSDKEVKEIMKVL